MTRCARTVPTATRGGGRYGLPRPCGRGHTRRRPAPGTPKAQYRNERAESQLSLTVLYDAECDFCRHTAHVLRTLDSHRRLRFRPLQDVAGLCAEVPPRAVLMKRLHVLDGGGAWYAGGDAMVRIAAELPALASLTIVARLPGADAVIDSFYGLIAAHRGAISRWLRLDRCRFAPDPAAP